LNAVLGVANSGVRVLRVTWLLQEVPGEVLGRVNSVISMLNVVIRVSFLALFSSVYFTEGGHADQAYGIMGIFVLACALVVLVFRKPILKDKIPTR
jgi:hypothetical protein